MHDRSVDMPVARGAVIRRASTMGSLTPTQPEKRTDPRSLEAWSYDASIMVSSTSTQQIQCQL
jgi:hypothetical protein